MYITISTIYLIIEQNHRFEQKIKSLNQSGYTNLQNIKKSERLTITKESNRLLSSLLELSVKR